MDVFPHLVHQLLPAGPKTACNIGLASLVIHLAHTQTALVIVQSDNAPRRIETGKQPAYILGRPGLPWNALDCPGGTFPALLFPVVARDLGHT